MAEANLRHSIIVDDEQGNPVEFEFFAPQAPTAEAFLDLIHRGQAHPVRRGAFGGQPGTVSTPGTPPPSPGERIEQAGRRGTHWAIPMALPTAGALGADALATMVHPALGPFGAAAGEGLGHWANTLLGIEPEASWEDIALGAGLPLGAELVAKGGKQLLKSTRGGRMVMEDLLNREGMEAVRAYVAKVPPEARELAKEYLKTLEDIPLQTAPMVDTFMERGVPWQFLDEMGFGAYIGPAGSTGLRRMKDLTVLDYQAVSTKASKAFAEAAREIERTGGSHEAKRRAEHALAVFDGIDVAFRDTLRAYDNRTGPGVTETRAMLRQLADTNRRLTSGGEMDALAERFTTRDADGTATVDVKALLTELRRKNTDEARQPLYDHLRTTLQDQGETSALARDLADMQRRFKTGIRIVPEALEGTMMGGLARGATRFGTGTAMGAVTGVDPTIAGPAYMTLSSAMSALLMSKRGRQVLKLALDKTRGRITERTLIALASAARPAAMGLTMPGMDEELSRLMGPSAAQAQPLAEPAIRTMPGMLSQPMGGRQLPVSGPLAAPIGAPGGIGSVASAPLAGPGQVPAIANAGMPADLFEQIYGRAQVR